MLAPALYGDLIRAKPEGLKILISHIFCEHRDARFVGTRFQGVLRFEHCVPYLRRGAH
jgi:hypothetical protein